MRNDYVFNNATIQPNEVGELIKTMVAMRMKVKYNIKVYTVKDFKKQLGGIRRVKL